MIAACIGEAMRYDEAMNIDTKRRAEIAASASIADPYLYQILTKRREASPELCVVLERVSGGQLTRRGLRPNDWHLIWPELIHATKVVA